MAQIKINLGTPPSGQDGDPVRTAFEKVNTMTAELYGALPTTGAPLPIAKGGTGGTTKEAAQANLGLIPVASASDNTVGKTPTVGWAGVGGQLQYRSSTPDKAFLAMSGASFWYAENGGGYPQGVTDGALISLSFATTGNFAYQLLGDWRTGYLHRRGRASDTSGTWARMYDTENAMLEPVASGFGGLMSSTVVNGYTVVRYASGLMHVIGMPGNSPTIAANASSSFDLTIPSGYISTNFISSAINIAAATSSDHYGVISAVPISATVIRITIRNGATPQTFGMHVSFWGRWK